MWATTWQDSIFWQRYCPETNKNQKAGCFAAIDTAPEKITARLSPFYLVMKFTCDQNPQNACYVNLAKLHCSCHQG